MGWIKPQQRSVMVLPTALRMHWPVNKLVKTAKATASNALQRRTRKQQISLLKWVTGPHWKSVLVTILCCWIWAAFQQLNKRRSGRWCSLCGQPAVGGNKTEQMQPLYAADHVSWQAEVFEFQIYGSSYFVLCCVFFFLNWSVSSREDFFFFYYFLYKLYNRKEWGSVVQEKMGILSQPLSIIENYS